jgi:hypothetical protein
VCNTFGAAGGGLNIICDARGRSCRTARFGTLCVFKLGALGIVRRLTRRLRVDSCLRHDIDKFIGRRKRDCPRCGCERRQSALERESRNGKEDADAMTGRR